MGKGFTETLAYSDVETGGCYYHTEHDRYYLSLGFMKYTCYALPMEPLNQNGEAVWILKLSQQPSSAPTKTYKNIVMGTEPCVPQQRFHDLL